MKPRHMLRIFSLLALIVLLAASLTALLLPTPARAAPDATITVTANSSDVLDADGGICATMTISDLPGPNNETSLREAICAANNTAGADTITLPAGTYLLTIAGHSENDNATGDLDITSSITINGAGADSTIIDANQLDRVLYVIGGAVVELNGLTLTNGKSPSAVVFHCAGGGVYNSGTLTIRDSAVSGNTTRNDSRNGCGGGGVYSGGTLTIESSTIRDNITGDAVVSGYSGGHGGGVFNSGTMTIRNSTIRGNSTGDGAGSGSDGRGGGVYNTTDGGTATIDNSTISGNAARGYGGGVQSYYSGASVTLIHCTITDNTADADNDYGVASGGGLSWLSSSGAGFSVKNTIIAGNTDLGDSGSDDCQGAPAGGYTSQGYNLVGSGTGCPTGANDQTTSDPKLGSLQNNGGPTETHALQYYDDSPAVERIPKFTNGCGDTYTSDQRGEPRPGGGLCDVGAYESPYIFWEGGGGDNNTSTAANWSGDILPVETDVPVFYNTSQGATVNADLTVAGWVMDNTYTGSIYLGLAPTPVLTVNGDWLHLGGYCSGEYGLIDIAGAFNLSGGQFVAPQGNGLLSVGGGFHHTGGSLNIYSGRIVLDNTSDQTLAPTTAFNDLVLNDGLLGYWKLDDGSGDTAADSSGYGHDGAVNGGPTWSDITPAVNFYDPYALHLDRSPADYVNIPNTTDIDGLQQLTLSAWVRLDTTPASERMRFVTLENEKAVLRYDDTDLHFYIKIDDGSGYSFSAIRGDSALSSGVWYHVAGTYDGSTMRLYLDGAAQSSTVPVSGAVQPGDGVTLSRSSESLDGILDDVRIYNRALSATEIGDLAAGNHPETSIATTTLGAALDVNGDLTLNSGTLDVSGSNYGINIAGDFARNGGVFETGGGMVTFDGSGDQNLDTDAIALYDLTVNNGATLVDLAVSAATFSVDGTLTNNGDLQQRRYQRSSEIQYLRILNQVGDAVKYYGVDLDPVASPEEMGWTTVTIGGNQDCPTTAGETVRRCFDIAPTTNRPAAVTFWYLEGERNSHTADSVNVYRWEGSAWAQEGGTYTRSDDGENYSVQVTDVDSYSPFVLRNPSRPEAVTDLSASDVGGSLRLDWTAVTEDSAGFGLASVTYDIYRAEDAPYFPPGTAYATGITDTWYVDSGVIGDPDYNYTYLVRAVSNGLTSDDSDRVGTFAFGLVAGSSE